MSLGQLIGVYVFGSVGRGEQDRLSDLDVLAVVKNGTGKVPESLVASYVPKTLSALQLSISWYGRDRIVEMFKNGELFAWHLHRETIPLFDPHGFLEKIGQPANYREALSDVGSFRKILTGIPSQVRANESNATYEAGLVYVCIRNIAMAASWSLCKFPDFSRYSPFKLEAVSSCPITKAEYELAMACRMASQRGANIHSPITGEFVLSLFGKLDPWVLEICSVLQTKADHGR